MHINVRYLPRDGEKWLAIDHDGQMFYYENRPENIMGGRWELVSNSRFAGICRQRSILSEWSNYVYELC